MLRGNIFLSRIVVCLFWFWAMHVPTLICQIKKLGQSPIRISWAQLGGQHSNQNVLCLGETTSIQHQNVRCQVSRRSAAEDILLPPLDWPGVCEEDMQQVAGAQWRQHSPAQPSEAVSREMGQWGSSSIKWWDIFCSSTRNIIINNMLQNSKGSEKGLMMQWVSLLWPCMSICLAFWPLSLLAFWPSKF